MKRTARRVSDRFMGLLQKDRNVILPVSKTNSLQRVYCIEKGMAEDKKIREDY